MSGRHFLDTNIFVYSFDALSPSKQKKARTLIDSALSTHQGLVSSQVVQEFLNVALRKFKNPLTIPEARAYLDDVLEPLCEVFPSLELYRNALQLKNDAHLAYYDAIMVAAASEVGCKILYTEDMPHGQVIAGVSIQNPFL